MFKLETDKLRKAVSMAVSEVYTGNDELFEINLRLAATEMVAETGRAYVVMTKCDDNTSYNAFGYYSDVDLAVKESVSNSVVEITKIDHGYKVVCIDDLFI